MLNKKWLTLALCSVAVSGMVGCADDTTDPQKPDDPIVVAGDPVIDLTSNGNKVKNGQEITIDATYSVDGVGQSGVTLKVTSSDPSCVSVTPYASINTVTGGKARIKAKGEGEDGCEAEITVSDGNNGDKVAQSKSVKITVSEDAEIVEPDPLPDSHGTLMLVDPSSGKLELKQPNETADVTVMYLGADGKPVQGVTVSAVSDDETCIKVAKSTQTDANGKASLTAKAAGEDCSAGIVLTVSNDEAATASVAGKVGVPADYRVNVQLRYLSRTASDTDNNVGSRVASIDSIKFGSVSGSCPSEADFRSKDVDTDFDMVMNAKAADLDINQNPVYTYNNFSLQTSHSDDIMAAYAMDRDGNVLAYGCSSKVTRDNEGQVVNVPMHEVGLEMAKTYAVVSNFDLSSGFTKSAVMPKAESMLAGDWIQFFLDFCEKPIPTLVEFIWANSIDRLADIKNDSGEAVMPEWLLSLISDKGTKAIAIGALTPMLEKYLNDYGWYKTITTISPDVKDLTSNMQLVGTFQMGALDDLKISGMKEEYRTLEYQWSYDKTKCSAESGYVKKDGCRRAMALNSLKTDKLSDGKGGTLSGTWAGSINDSATASYNGTLTVDSHDLKFKWATILYNAVLGEILPNALGYADAQSVKDGLLIKAFMEKLLFEPVVNYYNGYTDPEGNKHGGCVGHYDCDPATTGIDEELAGKTDDEKKNASAYPKLITTGENVVCQNFIEAIVYLIYKDASKLGDGISFVTGYACGENGIGQLDKLVLTQLSKLDAAADGRFKMSTLSGTDCKLYAEGNTYAEIGKPDSDPGTATANAVFTKGTKTERCKWNVNFDMTTKDETGATKGEKVNLKGLFHAKDSGGVL